MDKKRLLQVPAFWLKCRLLPLFFLLFFQLVALAPLYAQNIRVSGTVKDFKGNPVEGASVTVKGSNTGTTTDTEGRYSVAVPGSKSVIVFSGVGFLAKEETVGTRTTINPVLNESTNNLEEVVVIGYGTQRKRDVTGSITSVTAKQIEERQAVNLADALQGQAAGLLVINNSGEPGAESSITIRGG
ncbi:MAG TPA: carboxypeptidase-like regulatory domain-containing protein, partial [Chitinophagaceae bacterium]